MNGSVSRAIEGSAPHRIPSGTPTIDEMRKPQKMTVTLCQRLWCSHGSSARNGGVVKPVTSARATSCGAGRKTGFAGVPVAGWPPRARTARFSRSTSARGASSPAVTQSMSPASVTRSIGCHTNGT